MHGKRLSRQLKSRKSFASLEQEIFLSIQHMADLLMFDLNQLLKPMGLTNAGYNVLRILRGAGKEGLPCREIALRMLNRDPDITRLVDRLEGRALVARQRQTDDRRVVKVLVTRQGLDLLKGLDEPVLELHRRQLSHLGEQRLDELAKLLVLLREG